MSSEFNVLRDEVLNAPGFADDDDGRPGFALSIRDLADLYSAGKIPFPDDLSPISKEQFCRAVRERLRRRLVHVIAKAIARDLQDAPRRIGDSDYD